MAKKIKKNTRGNAAQYLTRAAALKKLQLSLADFRRLCILKGIYPRDPKRKPKGKDKTYYHVKDVLYLYHEPLVKKIRELRIFNRKYNRAVGRHEFSTAKCLEDRKPVYSLYQIVKERYPSLLDAVKDLDDVLSTIALVTCLSVNDDKGITSDYIVEATRLFDEMLFYISEKKILRKVFASIKGYYFEIKLLGQSIVFLLPHQFPQDIPPEVDFKVLLTFHELYCCMLKSINYKLYLMDGIKYPPSINPVQIKSGDRFMSYITETNLITHENNEIITDKFNNTEEDTIEKILEINEEEKHLTNIFSNFVFFLSREIPKIPICLCLRSCGASQIGWQGGSSTIKESDSSITHYVIDRPLSDNLKQYIGQREFIQPQWIFDCINSKSLLQTSPYQPNVNPPPHLSPFINNKDITNEQHMMIPRVEDIEEDAEDIEVQELEFKKNLESEKTKTDRQLITPTNSKEKKYQEEVIERKKALLSKKHKRLFEKIQHSKIHKNKKIYK